MDDDWYLIWSNEKESWWGPGECGYVRQMSRAGRYTREKAVEISTHAIPGTSTRLGMLPELPVRLADVTAMAAAFRATYPHLPPDSWE